MSLQITEISPAVYHGFVHTLYRNDPNFKDNKSGITPFLLNSSSAFAKNTIRRLLAVEEKGEILCACLLLVHRNAPTLLSVALFEARSKAERPVALLLEEARRWGKTVGAERMAVGLDGHVNYNVGFAHATAPPTFGESYNPPYYHDYFSALTPVKLVAYGDHAPEVEKRLLVDMKKYRQRLLAFSLETPGFSLDFSPTLRRFTDLNNQIFKGEPFYFKREYEEDRELFSTMRPLLRKENLIFAKENGVDIGFILWYPDFNELVPHGKAASLSTFFGHKLFRRSPVTIKVVEIGVLPRYRHQGVILLLLHQALTAIGNPERITSSWIFDHNTPSKALTSRYLTNLQKEYTLYEEVL